jgi:adenine/guanine phosphoribosyltransferase-like PRPP-binding protein
MADKLDDGGDAFIKPTTHFWQDILAADDAAVPGGPPYRYGYPARLPDGRRLVLPLRRLPDGNRAVASLIANQASFTVIDTLSGFMAGFARDAGAQQVIGMPTLGLSFAPLIAQRLGFTNYIPLGYSRKFWYRDDLSEPVHSITTPGAGKSVYIDPNMLPRLAGRRIALVDDAVSSGSTLISVSKLLSRLDCEIAAVVVAMRQGTAWRDNVAAADARLPGIVRGAIAAPLFEFGGDGWYPIAGTLDEDG